MGKAELEFFTLFSLPLEYVQIMKLWNTAKTAENFRQLCTNSSTDGPKASNGAPMTYRGSTFHRVIKSFSAFPFVHDTLPACAIDVLSCC